MGVVPPIQITADEVNQIVHAYLKDSGFEHTAFALRTEGRLDQSPYFDYHVPRGELVELLMKALLYIEVETHCKGEGLISDCKAPFRLLKRHACAADPLDDVNGASEGGSAGAAETNGKRTPAPATSGVGLVDALKRKADMPADGDVNDRRVKRSAEPDGGEGEPMALDSLDDAPSVLVAKTAVAPPPLNAKEKRDVFNREQGLKTPKKAIVLLKGHVGEVFVGAWNPTKHNILATGGKDATVRLWTLPDPPTDPTEFSGPPDKDPVLLDHNFGLTNKDITCLDWTPDGNYLATGSYDSVLRVWTSDGNQYWSNGTHQGPIFATKFSMSGRWLLTASLDGTACVWDIYAKKVHQQFKAHEEVCLDVDWLTEDTFVTCGSDRRITICRFGHPEPIIVFQGHTDEINQVKFNPSKTLLVSCSDDKTARIWNLRKVPHAEAPALAYDKDSLVLEGHNDSIGCVGWCPEPADNPRDIVATTAFDGTARLWDAKTGACLHAFHDHVRAAYTLTFSPDGRFFATTGGDSHLYVYDVKGGKRLWSFAPEGRTIGGIYEICWETVPDLNLNRIALCMESEKIACVDVTKIPALNRIST